MKKKIFSLFILIIIIGLFGSLVRRITEKSFLGEEEGEWLLSKEINFDNEGETLHPIDTYRYESTDLTNIPFYLRPKIEIQQEYLIEPVIFKPTELPKDSKAVFYIQPRYNKSELLLSNLWNTKKVILNIPTYPILKVVYIDKFDNIFAEEEFIANNIGEYEIHYLDDEK